MPIKTYKIDQEWGQIWFLKSDPHQRERCLVGILTLPGNEVQFALKAFDEDSAIFAYPFECTEEPDPIKKLNNREDGNEGDVT